MRKIMIGLLLLALIMPGIVYGAEKWTQGKFAMWLVRKVGAEGLLPPAATVQDYFNFLRRNGIEPPGGWEEDKILTVSDLEAMLGLKPGAGYTFEELLKMIEELLEEILFAAPEAPVISPIVP